jgi:PrtD family type I secretion system ABC transporter
MAMFTRSNEFIRLVRTCRKYFAAAAAFSLAINLLYLAGPLYMLQVYDRVVSSGSQLTLIMLTVVLLFAYLALVGLDIVRARILTRASIRLDQRISPRLLAVMIESAGVAGSGARGQILRDFDTFRGFITGTGIHGVFDMPWAPIYIFVIFLLHPLLGAFALAGAIVLVVLAFLNEWLVKPPLNEASAASTRNYSFTEMSLRNAEVIRAMAMTDCVARRWSKDRDQMLERQVVASDRGCQRPGHHPIPAPVDAVAHPGSGRLSRHRARGHGGRDVCRQPPAGRALQPVEQVVGSWRAWSPRAAHSSAFASCSPKSLRRAPARVVPGHWAGIGRGPEPRRAGNPKPLLRGVTFALEPGEVLGVIGPSGAGKSTLARHLVGVLKPTAGAVRLDGADVSQWVDNSLGRYVGYLPQDIELFSDTVSANISRFQAGMDEEVLRASQAAGVHDLVLRLPRGYDTPVGEGGAVLSGGYRQRLALARAVFGDPRLVVLDEPSSNLDQDGDLGLMNCIAQLKQRGVTVVLISHRPSTIGVVDKILVLNDGMVEMFGSRGEVMAKLTDAARRAAAVQARPSANVPAKSGP